MRENADNRLYGNLGHLAPAKAARPGMQIAVGGCLAQKDRGEIARRAPWVDVVFGTHNMGSLPALLERARHNGEAQVEILESLEVFPSTLPTRRESAYAAWVSISVGCNNTCTFCIVPSLRGTEKDRRPGDVLAEVEALVAEGVLEVTLLGQNVNSYGAEFGDREAFAKLLRACGEIEGLERVRFTSPHPRDFTDDVIAAMAETPNVMPQLHMPLQSGSDRVLRAMRRSYRSDRYLGHPRPGAGRDARTRRSPPTSSSGSRARPRRTSPTTLRRGRAGALRRGVHVPVLQAARHAGRRAWPTRCRPTSWRSATTRLVALQDEIALAGEPRRRSVGSSRCWCRGRRTQGRRHAPAVRAGARQPAGPLQRRAALAPRPGDVVTVEVTYARPAPPGGRRRAAGAAPHPGGRRVAGTRAGGRTAATGVRRGLPRPAGGSSPGRLTARLAVRDARG